MSIATTAPQRSQGMSLLSITSLGSGAAADRPIRRLHEFCATASASAKRFFTHFCSGCSLQGLNNESRIKSGRAAADHGCAR